MGVCFFFLSFSAPSAARDIVQFVPMNKFSGRGPHTQAALAKVRRWDVAAEGWGGHDDCACGRSTDPECWLARHGQEVLAELPDQFLQYMRLNKISPPPKGPSAPPM